jgi:hypothetical protein
MPNSWHTSNGSFLTKRWSKVNLKFFEYSNIKQYLITPDVVEYDKKMMTKPVYAHSWLQTMKELGIVLDFQRKERTVDEISLPMRDINSMTTSKMEKPWAVNNSMAHESSSMQEVQLSE